jgi:diguanylate cyclase (GGDEF)-like protein
VAVFTDITARKQQEERLKYLAHYDVLTGLPNRFLFYDRLNQGLAQAERHQHLLAVMFLDLDRFKYINDTLGHDFGDLVLIDVAARLKSCLRSEDTVARLGGDEFTIILPNINSEQDAARVAQKIIDMISKPFSVQGHELFVTPSIGISLYPYDGVLADTLLKCADMAMYRAKERGNQYQFYTSEMNHSTAQRFSMEGSLRKALENQEFFLQYQPRFDLHTGRVAGVEALLRWENPELGVVSPAEFISLAEETGLIVPIGYWVLKEACLQKKRWQQSGYGSLSISVNVSPCQLQQADFAERVSNILQETGVEPQGLELEITENLFVQDDEHYMDVLNKLLALGLHISIDDFGTGYSSLQYLKRLRVHCLKIDRSFIQGLPVDAGNAAITSAIVKLAHDLNMRIVAEGVESEQELQFLSKVGCDEIQGFYFCPPISVEALEPILHQYSPC